jgi:hypothetical protein
MTDESKKTALVISDDQDVQDAITGSSRNYDTVAEDKCDGLDEAIWPADLVVVDQRLPSSRSVDLEDMYWLWSGLGVIVIGEDYSNPAAVAALRWADDYVRWPLGSGSWRCGSAISSGCSRSKAQMADHPDRSGSVVNLVERWSDVDNTRFTDPDWWRSSTSCCALESMVLRDAGGTGVGIERGWCRKLNALRVHMPASQKLEQMRIPAVHSDERGGGISW